MVLWTSLAKARRYGSNVGDIDHTIRLACRGNVEANFIPRRIHKAATNLGNIDDVDHAVSVEIIRGERTGRWRELGCVDVCVVVADHPELAYIGVARVSIAVVLNAVQIPGTNSHRWIGVRAQAPRQQILRGPTG